MKEKTEAQKMIDNLNNEIELLKIKGYKRQVEEGYDRAQELAQELGECGIRVQICQLELDNYDPEKAYETRQGYERTLWAAKAHLAHVQREISEYDVREKVKSPEELILVLQKVVTHPEFGKILSEFLGIYGEFLGKVPPLGLQMKKIWDESKGEEK